MDRSAQYSVPQRRIVDRLCDPACAVEHLPSRATAGSLEGNMTMYCLAMHPSMTDSEALRRLCSAPTAEAGALVADHERDLAVSVFQLDIVWFQAAIWRQWVRVLQRARHDEMEQCAAHPIDQHGWGSLFVSGDYDLSQLDWLPEDDRAWLAGRLAPIWEAFDGDGERRHSRKAVFQMLARLSPAAQVAPLARWVLWGDTPTARAAASQRLLALIRARPVLAPTASAAILRELATPGIPVDRREEALRRITQLHRCGAWHFQTRAEGAEAPVPPRIARGR
jgi:hypothetical protein